MLEAEHKRVCRLMQSEIRNMSVECERMGGINLSQGLCDLPLPHELAAGAKTAIDEGENAYTRFDGIEELRCAIAGKLQRYNKMQKDPKTEIIVTSGATGALYAACLALLEPGDEVILFEPFYGYHEYTLAALDISPVYVQLEPPDWVFDLDAFEQAIGPRTKGVLINTPANPSGKVFSEREIKLLLEICSKKNLIVFTDEIYEYFVYDGRAHVSPGALDTGRVITISGYSKTFSITGWRIGYCSCEKADALLVGYAHDLVYVCAPSPLQRGVARAVDTLSDAYYLNLKRDYQNKRDLLCSALQNAGLTPYSPQGAYYILADAGGLKGETAKQKAMELLWQTGVAAVPGSAFYRPGGGENLLRFCFAKQDAVLHEACERLQNIKRG